MIALLRHNSEKIPMMFFNSIVIKTEHPVHLMCSNSTESVLPTMTERTFPSNSCNQLQVMVNPDLDQIEIQKNSDFTLHSGGTS